MDIRIAAKNTRDLLGNIEYSSKKGCDKHHIEWMLRGIELGYIQHEKAHRWLGWAQAIICIAGDSNLDELKDVNFRA